MSQSEWTNGCLAGLRFVNRPRRFLSLIVVVAVLAGTAVVWRVVFSSGSRTGNSSVTHHSNHGADKPSEQGTPEEPAEALEPDSRGDSAPPEAESRDPAVIDSGLPTSWQNPFRADLWNGSEWSFTDAAMNCSAQAQSAAVFVRPYRQLMLEFIVTTTNLESEVPAPVAVKEMSSAFLDVRLANFSGDDALLVRFAPASASVLREVKGNQITLRTAPVEEPATHCLVRLVLTGQRLLVHRDNKLLININRPTSHMKSPIQLALLPQGSPLLISTMRLEGE